MKLLKSNIEKSWFDYQDTRCCKLATQQCCPNCCPAQIFSSLLWKTQYIRLSYGLCFGVSEMKMKLGSIKENPFPINTITKTNIVQFQLLDSKWWRTKSTIKWFHFLPCRDIPSNFQTISEGISFFLGNQVRLNYLYSLWHFLKQCLKK